MGSSPLWLVVLEFSKVTEEQCWYVYNVKLVYELSQLGLYQVVGSSTINLRA